MVQQNPEARVRIIRQLGRSPLLRREGYRGTSLIRHRAPLGPYGSNMRRALWWSWGSFL